MRTVRPESRRYLPARGPDGLSRLAVDPLSSVVPFVPLPGPKNAWAIVCPAGCDTELIILPEYAGAWVECPTCGFRFLGPHPAQPQMVAKARAAAAQAAAEEKRMAGALAALARPSPEPPGPASPAPKERPPAAEKQPPPRDLAQDQSKAQAALEVLEKASRAAAPASPAPKSRRQIIADVKATTQRSAPTKAQPGRIEPAAGAAGQPGPRYPAAPAAGSMPPPAAPGEKVPDQELTPEESKALGALEVLAKAKGGPGGARKPRSAVLPAAEQGAAPAELGPDESRALDALVMLAMTNQTASAASPGALAAKSKKAANRRARQRLDIEPKARAKHAVAGRRPARARPVTAGAPGAASRLAGRGDLILTWVVSLVIAAGIIVAAFACGLPDLALGSVVFIGLAVVRTWVAFRSPKDDLPF
ncbi:MAG: hypothetical protein IMZ44_25325 [Planctomycetes bacterium]|nr:hypothetical protein [Planctomycetota bacterium]